MEHRNEPGVVLGPCGGCGRPVAHDERGAEFVYSQRDPALLQGALCPACADLLYDGPPTPEQLEEFGRMLGDLGVKPAKIAAVAARLGAGERVPSDETAAELKVSAAESRLLTVFTSPEERLRRHGALQRRERRRGIRTRGSQGGGGSNPQGGTGP
jgi:hypothetical protein